MDAQSMNQTFDQFVEVMVPLIVGIEPPRGHERSRQLEAALTLIRRSQAQIKRADGFTASS